jgi:hypothetical protein
MYMGGDDDADEGAIGLGHENGKSFMSISAKQAEVGKPEFAEFALSLEGDKVIVRDMKGKEIVSFTIPASAIALKKD